MNDYEMIILHRTRQRDLLREREAVEMARNVQKAADPCAPTWRHQVKRWARLIIPKPAHSLPKNSPCPDIATS